METFIDEGCTVDEACVDMPDAWAAAFAQADYLDKIKMIHALERAAPQWRLEEKP